MRLVRRKCKHQLLQIVIMVAIIYFLRMWMVARFSDTNEGDFESDVKDSKDAQGDDEGEDVADIVEELQANQVQGTPNVLVKEDDENLPDDHVRVKDKGEIDIVYVDKRNPECDTTRLSKRIDPATIIVPFCEEPLEVLLELLRSIKANTWKRLVYEVVFMRGKCKSKTPGVQMEVALENEYDEVMLVRAGDERGLMEARRKAYLYTTAPTLVFVDVNSRLTPNWLRPLLEVLEISNTSIAAPMIETVDTKTGHYAAPFNGSFLMLFDWYLRARMVPMPKHHTGPYPMPYGSPLIPSPAFAINRHYFQTIGGWDSVIRAWGPAQLELSIKTWLCGGTIMVVPCSRVLYPRVSFELPTDLDDPLGYKRVSELWLSKEQKRAVYRRRRDLVAVETGSLVDLKQRKKDMECKTIDYLFEMTPVNWTSIFPLVEPEPFAFGLITTLSKGKSCITTSGEDGDRISMQKCVDDQNQIWYLDRRKVIKNFDSRLCWTVDLTRDTPALHECSLEEVVPEDQLWIYDPVLQHIEDKLTKRCLTLMEPFTLIRLQECDAAKRSQKWVFEDADYDLIAREMNDD